MKKISLIGKKVPLGQYGEETETILEDITPIEEKFDSYSNAIGSFMLTFSDLEASVDNDLATAINERTHEPGYRIIKYLKFMNKINLLKDEYTNFICYFVSGSKKDKLIKEINTIHNKLVELNAFRNKVAHADWNSLDDDGFVRTKIEQSKTKGGIDLKKIKMTPNVILKFKRQNIATGNKIAEFRDKIWYEAQKSEMKGQKNTKRVLEKGRNNL